MGGATRRARSLIFLVVELIYSGLAVWLEAADGPTFGPLFRWSFVRRPVGLREADTKFLRPTREKQGTDDDDANKEIQKKVIEQ